MTQKQFNAEYKLTYSNWEVMTLTDRRVNYNAMIEHYANSGHITERQRQTWGHPSFLTSKKNKIDCSAY
jgi:hypothetical protein